MKSEFAHLTQLEKMELYQVCSKSIIQIKSDAKKHIIKLIMTTFLVVISFSIIFYLLFRNNESSMLMIHIIIYITFNLVILAYFIGLANGSVGVIISQLEKDKEEFMKI